MVFNHLLNGSPSSKQVVFFVFSIFRNRQLAESSDVQILSTFKDTMWDAKYLPQLASAK